MDKPEDIRCKVYIFGQFTIKYWASGSNSTYRGIGRVPCKKGLVDWDEPFENDEIFVTANAAELAILEYTKEKLREFCKVNNILLKE